MSSRKRRHTRATFADLVHPNFEELAHENAEFSKAWHAVKEHQKEHGGSLASNVTQDFSMATTRALLHIYFSLRLPQIPTLCPPVPNRYFLVRWMNQQLLPLVRGGKSHLYFESPFGTQQRHDSSTRFGIDLGTGATCIYPLLFCAPTVDIEDDNNSTTTTRGGDWKWLASEVSSTSVQKAIENVQANRLSSQIQVVHVAPTATQQRGKSRNEGDDAMVQDEDDNNHNHETDVASSSDALLPASSDDGDDDDAGPLLRLLQALPEASRPTGICDCVITNPPFHDPTSSNAVPHKERAGDQRVRTTLTEDEASYPGGEVAFLTDMLVDALRLMPLPSTTSTETTGSTTDNSNTMLALWYASMVGKKTTLNKMLPILSYLLGPARVQSTQFGPGNLTRWFLAWTFCRPCPRSPLAIYNHNHNNKDNAAPSKDNAILSFDVTLQDKTEIARGVVSEVSNRLVDYFQTVPGYKLTAHVTTPNSSSPSATICKVTVQEETPHVLEWDANLLPPLVLKTLRNRNITLMDFSLPAAIGHFLLDVSIVPKGLDVVTVQIHAYVHSKYGRTVVDKITSHHLEAEICRTSRKWRRIFQRQQQQQQPSSSSDGMAID